MGYGLGGNNMSSLGGRSSKMALQPDVILSTSSHSPEKRGMAVMESNAFLNLFVLSKLAFLL